ncbi:MAG: DUF4350 domain-containing protein [Myxococcota bacterium]|nr:DUF4350 domain-containing protein [Myxococcota bacterium]
MKYWLAILLFLSTTPGHGELKPDGFGWSDLGRALSAGRASGVDLSVAEVDLNRQQLPGERLLLISPTCTKATAQSLAFIVRRGGRIAIVAERSTSNSCLSVFGVAVDPDGIDRTTSTTQPDLHRGYLKAQSAILPDGRILANRPSRILGHTHMANEIILSNEQVIGGLIRWGAGQVMVIGDTSIFINAMLPALDNEALIVRLLNWLSGSERHRVYIFGPDSANADSTGAQLVARTQLNSMSGRLLMDERVLLVICMILGVVILTMAMQNVSAPSKIAHPDAHWSVISSSSLHSHSNHAIKPQDDREDSSWT